MYKNWKEYQEATASFFRKQGCSVKEEAKITGARGKHAIDVYVSFSNHGIETNWVIECKLWRNRVPKEKVLALKAIVEDVGADRGIIISEKGFQRGAYDAARKSNITLVTSLKEFERTAKPNVNFAEIPLNLVKANNEPPIYELPNKSQPHSILQYDEKIFTGNWESGNITIIDPDKKIIESIIDLDSYEFFPSDTEAREIRQYPPGSMTIADGKIFLGQVFSDFVLAIDIATKSIVKRLAIPGGGEGSITSSPDGKYVYFASNKENSFFIIDSATYKYERIAYPRGGRGSLSILAHPTRPYLLIGIQRGGKLNGVSYFGGNSFLAVYNLINKAYTKNIYLAEIINGESDNSVPACILCDEDHHIYVGMFQSRKGVYKIDEESLEIIKNIEFKPNQYNKHFSSVDALSLASHKNFLISLNRNNRELAFVDKLSGTISKSIYLGEAPNGPENVIVHKNECIISYPEKRGLVFINLEEM